MKQYSLTSTEYEQLVQWVENCYNHQIEAQSAFAQQLTQTLHQINTYERMHNILPTERKHKAKPVA